MSIDEIITWLEVWKRYIEALDAPREALYALTGAMPDCALLDPVYQLADAYTAAVENVVGDKFGWIGWYSQECDMGRKARDARPPGGKLRKVRTLRQLARIIKDSAA